MGQLALLDDHGAARAKDLAAATGVPEHYISKLLRKLVVAGLLDSRKGHGGGFSLARAPAEIRFVDIFRAVDYEVEPNRCRFGWGRCNPARPCLLHAKWSEIQTEFEHWATTSTLADVATSQNEPYAVWFDRVVPETEVLSQCITEMIEAERSAGSSKERKELLSAMADVRASTASALSVAQNYLLSKDERYLTDFQQRWASGGENLALLESMSDLFTDTQRAALKTFVTTRRRLTPVMLQVLRHMDGTGSG